MLSDLRKVFVILLYLFYFLQNESHKQLWNIFSATPTEIDESISAPPVHPPPRNFISIPSNISTPLPYLTTQELTSDIRLRWTACSLVLEVNQILISSSSFMKHAECSRIHAFFFFFDVVRRLQVYFHGLIIVLKIL